MKQPQEIFTPGYLRYALAILALANFVNYMDRMVLSVVLEPIKHEFTLSDTQAGLLAGFAFALFYGTIGIFIARWADRASRRRIIALSMLLWSVLTVLTGAVRNFGQLFLTRVGVGVGEAGVIPTANALIADYFEPRRRAGALAVFTAAATVGITAGLTFGGWAADRYGWRWAFVGAGLPGVPLSWLIWKTLREPPRGLSDGKVEAPAQALSLATAVRALLGRKTYFHVVLGGCFIHFVLHGILQWMPTFMIRKFGLAVGQVGLFFGMAVGLGAAFGAVLGGWATNRLVRGDLRWLIRLPLITSVFYLPVYEAALFAPSAAATFTLVFLINIVGGASFGPMLAVIQSVVPATMRATAAAFFGLSASVIGVGGAPFLIGLMSDALTPSMGGAKALQVAMAIAVLFSVLILFHFRRAMHFFARDMGELPELGAKDHAVLAESAESIR